jgi:hypothetical protein
VSFGRGGFDVRTFILRLAAAALMFTAGTILTNAAQFPSPELLVSAVNSFFPLVAYTLGAFWCFVFAFTSGEDKGELPFVVMMVVCGSAFLLAVLATLAGILFDGFRP